MLTQFQLWSFRTPRYHFKWYAQPNENTQDFTSILSVTDGEGIEIYRDYQHYCKFMNPQSVDQPTNQGLPFYAMVKEAIKFLKKRST